MAGAYLRGAFVRFEESLRVPRPSVVVFQFNPESMTHTWTPAAAAASTTDGGPSHPLAVSGEPGESFSFTLLIDANDMITDGGRAAGALARETGIYSRLAALELLMFPTDVEPGLRGQVSIAVGPGGVSTGGGAGVTRRVPRAQVPLVVFIWGGVRVVPVRLTGLTITETLYDERLNPTHAEVQISLRVITQQELHVLTGPLRLIAQGSAAYSHRLRQTLAATDIGDPVDSIIGMLPG